MKKRIEIVVPCFNEEECIIPLFEEIKNVFKKSIRNYSFSLLFVDDGSKDNTLKTIKSLVRTKKAKIKYISFARNFGKESAIFAGLEKSTGDYVVLMDADLQHPPAMLPKMIEKIEEGYDCVGCQRVSRNGEPPIRSFFSKIFYKFINNITSMNLVSGGSDYRIMSKQMVDAVVQLTERERFIKGILGWVGFDTAWIPYDNVERYAGSSKWSFVSLLKYAWNGFISFATTPLRIVGLIGTIIVFISFISMIRIFIDAIKNGTSGTGYATILTLLLFFNGIILIVLGVIGEYLARIYLELKHRPIYIEKETNINF